MNGNRPGCAAIAAAFFGLVALALVPGALVANLVLRALH